MLLGTSYFFWVVFLLLGIIFFYFPQIDIWFSGLFFRDGEFYLRNQWLIQFIYDVTHPVVALFFLSILGLLGYALLKRKKPFGLTRRMLVFILAAIIMAPGVVVNLTLKDNVDRARPKHITQFGGDMQFTPAFVVGTQCEKNCSFVCGHAAAGFSFIALAMVFTGKRRRWIFNAAVGAGFLIGLVRVIQGGHFLSDVFFAFFFTYITIRLLYYLIVERVTGLYEKTL
jgi:lipid A 4'-phosphatase